MSRRGNGTWAIVVMGILSILVAGSLLLFVDDEESARLRQQERLAREEKAREEAFPDPLKARPEVVDDESADDGPVVIPAGFAVEGRAEIEGGFGLHAVSFLDMETYEDGDYGAWLEEGPNDDVETGEDGRVTLRWSRGDAPVILMALREKMEFVRVENATLIRSDDDGVIFAVERGTGRPFKVIYRDVEGARNIRLKDAGTGRILRFNDNLTWVWRGRVESPGGRGVSNDDVLAVERHVSSGTGGWIGLWKFRDHEKSVEVRAPGYQSKRLLTSEIGPRTEVLLEPTGNRIEGTLLVDFGEGPKEDVGSGVSVVLLPAFSNGAQADPVHGLPNQLGEFSLWEVPAGRWALHATVFGDETRRYGTFVFEHDGGPLDVGDLVVKDWCGLEVRIVDEAFVPVKGLVVHVRPNETSVRRVAIAHRGLPIFDETVQATTDAEGMVSFGGLRPGAGYQVTVARVPDLGFQFRTPDTSGEWVKRNLTWEGRLVRCRFLVTVKGKRPKIWGALMNKQSLNAEWAAKDVPMEIELLPGRHTLRVMASLEGKRTFQIYSATVTVPDQREYEADVDFK
ncbi:MAG: hypothetical protein ACYTG4_06185 [Planctomycetota bacterium]